MPKKTRPTKEEKAQKEERLAAARARAKEKKQAWLAATHNQAEVDAKKGKQAGFANARVNGAGLPEASTHSIEFKNAFISAYQETCELYTLEKRLRNKGYRDGYFQGRDGRNFSIPNNESIAYGVGFKEGYDKGKSKYDFGTGKTCGYQDGIKGIDTSDTFPDETEAFLNGYKYGHSIGLIDFKKPRTAISQSSANLNFFPGPSTSTASPDQQPKKSVTRHF